MNDSRLFTVAVAVLVSVGIAGAGFGTASADNSARSSATTSGVNKAGRYQGKVGTFARIIMKTSKRKIKRLDAGVSALCQRASDGSLKGPELVAMRASPKIKIKKNGKFKGSGQDKNGVSWEINGRFVSKKKAKGTFKASVFRPVFNPNVSFDGDLCSGSGKWTAKLKR